MSNTKSIRIIKAEIPLVQKIVQDETWLEGERRGCPVESNDEMVQMRVIDICLKESEKLRKEAEEFLKNN